MLKLIRWGVILCQKEQRVIRRPPSDTYYKWRTIPFKEQSPNYYRLLGVTLPESDPDVIAGTAYQRMAHVRSFQTGSHAKLSQQILNELAAARVCLLNPEKKAAYDQTLCANLARLAVLSVAEPPIVATAYTQTIHKTRKKTAWWIPWAFSLLGLVVAIVLIVMIANSDRGAKEVASTSAVAEPSLPTPLRATTKSQPQSPPKTDPKPESKQHAQSKSKPEPIMFRSDWVGSGKALYHRIDRNSNLLSPRWV